jgi:hypothetical protein
MRTKKGMAVTNPLNMATEAAVWPSPQVQHLWEKGEEESWGEQGHGA